MSKTETEKIAAKFSLHVDYRPKKGGEKKKATA
jgi:hypothetical protein